MPFEFRLHGKESSTRCIPHDNNGRSCAGHGSHPALIPLSSIAIPLFENPPTHMGGHMYSTCWINAHEN